MKQVISVLNDVFDFFQIQKVKNIFRTFLNNFLLKSMHIFGKVITFQIINLSTEIE